MKTKEKKDFQGNKVVLNGKKLYHYNNNGKLQKITEHLSEKNALQEFNTITLSYRGCGENKWRKRACATVHYHQLIIQL